MYGGRVRMSVPMLWSMGFIFTVVLGIVGALIGGFLGRIMGLYGEGDSAGFVMAVVGAMVLLAVFRFIGGGPQRV